MFLLTSEGLEVQTNEGTAVVVVVGQVSDEVK
jgi:hypothetical protein